MGELEPMLAVIVANGDNHESTVAFHTLLAKHLPASTRMLVVGPEGVAVPENATEVSMPVDSPWARDFAPTFVRNRVGEFEAVEFSYSQKSADGVASALAKGLGIPLRTVNMKLEGGNLLVDSGRAFLTRRALTQNPELSQAAIETMLKEALHVDSIEWLDRLPKEPTGHIDMFARLISPGTMLVSDSMNPHQKPTLDAAAARFEALGYKVVRVTNPAFKPRDPEEDPGWGPTLSYANAFIINGTAFVPQYDRELYEQLAPGLVSSHDTLALKAYRDAGFKVVPVPAADLILSMGSVHCMTHTVPAGLDLSKAFPA